MTDNLMTHKRWQWFVEQVERKVGKIVAPEDVIDLARMLEPDEVFEGGWLFNWVKQNLV